METVVALRRQIKLEKIANCMYGFIAISTILAVLLYLYNTLFDGVPDNFVEETRTIGLILPLLIINIVIYMFETITILYLK